MKELIREGKRFNKPDHQRLQWEENGISMTSSTGTKSMHSMAS